MTEPRCDKCAAYCFPHRTEGEALVYLRQQFKDQRVVQMHMKKYREQLASGELSGECRVRSVGTFPSREPDDWCLEFTARPKTQDFTVD